MRCLPLHNCVLAACSNEFSLTLQIVLVLRVVSKRALAVSALPCLVLPIHTYTHIKLEKLT